MVRVLFVLSCLCCQDNTLQLNTSSLESECVRKECKHFNFKIRTSGSAGWCFGMNAKLEFRMTATCKKCFEKRTIYGSYWGWPRGIRLTKVLNVNAGIFLDITMVKWDIGKTNSPTHLVNSIVSFEVGNLTPLFIGGGVEVVKQLFDYASTSFDKKGKTIVQVDKKYDSQIVKNIYTAQLDLPDFMSLTKTSTVIISTIVLKEPVLYQHWALVAELSDGNYVLSQLWNNGDNTLTIGNLDQIDLQISENAGFKKKRTNIQRNKKVKINMKFLKFRKIILENAFPYFNINFYNCQHHVKRLRKCILAQI